VLGLCVSCHVNDPSASHIKTSDVCEACHEVAPGVWQPLLAGRMDHQEVVGVCSACHDNVIATGKHALHIVTIEECNACHGVTAWLPAAADHSSYVDNCITCHDGTIASGKTNLHFPATDKCDACHEKFPALWQSVVATAVDHTPLSGTCISCRDGVFSAGQISQSHEYQ